MVCVLVWADMIGLGGLSGVGGFCWPVKLKPLPGGC